MPGSDHFWRSFWASTPSLPKPEGMESPMHKPLRSTHLPDSAQLLNVVRNSVLRKISYGFIGVLSICWLTGWGDSLPLSADDPPSKLTLPPSQPMLPPQLPHPVHAQRTVNAKSKITCAAP